MESKNYIMGKANINLWRSNDSQQLTFVVTQDCNLRCKYCYMTDKNNKHIMDFDTAKKIIDYFVDNKDLIFTTDYVVLDFIGGGAFTRDRVNRQDNRLFYIKHL